MAVYEVEISYEWSRVVTVEAEDVEQAERDAYLQVREEFDEDVTLATRDEFNVTADHVA